MGILYLFVEGLRRNPRTVREEVPATPTAERVDTSDRWTYEDLPKEWPEAPDTSLAREGEELFQTRGCRVCHTVGEGDLVGPDLKGIDRVRDYRWTLLMLLRPDSMQRYDPVARDLLKRYGVQMPDQRLTLREAEAILHYILLKGRGN